MIIGVNVKVKGDMKFEGLIKIEGHIDGRVAAPLEVNYQNIIALLPTFI